MSVLRALVGWLIPLVIFGAGIAMFLSMGSQPPPERKRSEAATATPVRTREVRPAGSRSRQMVSWYRCVR